MHKFLRFGYRIFHFPTYTCTKPFLLLNRANITKKSWQLPKRNWTLTCWEAATSCGLPVAIWRKPFGHKVHGAVHFDDSPSPLVPELETLPPGFLMAAFENDQKAFFIKADFSFDSETERMLGEKVPHSNPHAVKFGRALQRVLNGDEIATASLPEITPATTAEADFKEWVAKGKQAVIDEAFQKVVLSRTLSEPLPADFNAHALFLQLCSAYPTALISLVFLPGKGIWIGASPEILVEVKDRQFFKTISLAGTQKIEPQQDLMAVAWTQKEIEEQALVGRYIINCFKKIRLREYEEIGPKTVAAGHLAHLRSDFTVDMAAQRFPELGTVMLELLHPTSAVCGMPKAESLAFIQGHETHQREFYAGFLGPVNIENHTHLFVNLRCMKITHGMATYFAGAGITSGSDPDKEWTETSLKIAILRKIVLPIR